MLMEGLDWTLKARAASCCNHGRMDVRKSMLRMTTGHQPCQMLFHHVSGRSEVGAQSVRQQVSTVHVCGIEALPCAAAIVVYMCCYLAAM